MIDHREINHDLGVFATDPLVGAGLPLWLPHGASIRHEVERLAHDLARRDGCREVYSPVLGKRALFERSGHWAKFADDMFAPMAVGGDELVLRPANCPHHAMIFRAQAHSYRELPIRLHELGAMFRAERSGVLQGLSRVRQINLDDTHVFCRPDQIADEVAKALRSALEAQRILGLPVDHVRLSRRGEQSLGDDEPWAHAEAALRAAAPDAVDAPGEAAFYGPKLDLQLGDETIATVQLDFVQPERFDLAYTAADGHRERPVMIHRGTVGSMERVVAALLERYEGRLPLWLAPVQVAVLPVGPEQDAAAHALLDELAAAGLRARLDAEGSLGARIRAGRVERVAVLAVLGADEVAAGTVQVIDVAAGFRGTTTKLADALKSAYDSRAEQIDWSDARG